MLVAGLLLAIRPARNSEKTVVVYTSVDAEFALPLFEKFTAETGIAVVPRMDGEAVKTTAMAERLMQMRLQPDGDVFWNSELSQTLLLAQSDVFEGYVSPKAKDIPEQWRDKAGRWTAFGCRARVIIYNTQRLKREEVPTTLEGLADPKFRKRFCIAKPTFGTTLSHLASVVIADGEEKAFKLFRAWRENGVVLAEGNGDVRNRVAEGSFDLGLTDSDDVFSAMERGKPVDFIVPDQTTTYRGAYLIPNSVGLLKNAAHAANGRKFIDFLLKPETEKWLAENGAKQIPVRDVGATLAGGLEHLQAAKVDAERLGTEAKPLATRILGVLQGEQK